MRIKVILFYLTRTRKKYIHTSRTWLLKCSKYLFLFYFLFCVYIIDPLKIEKETKLHEEANTFEKTI